MKRRINQRGYYEIYMPNHPFCDLKGYVREHRLKMEEWLRVSNPSHPAFININGMLYIHRGWVIHHKNHDKLDNRIANLEIYSNEDHSRGHSIERWQAYNDTTEERKKIANDINRETISSESE